ncbi:MAG: 4Fe-4S binding protein [Firmicutes bacterium]|nr:4Fe-4S binding protein [Candidatus Colivicinus equi]
MSEKSKAIELDENEIQQVSGGVTGESSPITIDYSLCDGCGVCIRECQEGALRLEEGRVYVDDDKCTRCCYCEVMCPPAAIKVN